MTSLRQDLEAEDATKQATALLQVLNYLAGGREVGNLVTIACQSVLSRPASGASKKLAYDIAKTAALSSDDWDAACEGLRADVAGSHSPEVQCSALEVLPLAPMPKLLKLFTDGELAKHIISCLQSSLPEVRAAAATSVAHLLSSQDLLQHLASSGNLLTAVTQWAGLLGAALSDPAPAVIGAAHAALQRILGSIAHAGGSNAGMLQDKFAGALCQRVVKSLGSVLEQAQTLSAGEQVVVPGALVAVVRYGQACHWKLAEAAPHDDLSAGSFSGGSTAQGHQGYWVAQQVGDYLVSIVNSSDASISFQAAQSLLQLTQILSSKPNSGGIRAVAGVASSWGPLAVAALLQLWDRQLSFAGHAQLMVVLTEHLPCLQVPSQLALVKELMPLIATLPSAAARTAALARVWHAVVQADLATRRAVRSGDKAVPGAQLKNVLTEPFVMGIISGTFTGTGPTGAAISKNTSLKEEVAATLLQVLRLHPRASTPVPQGIPNSDQGIQQSQDISVITEGAAYSQSIAELTDWLGSAKIALQGTKACLGWDREPQGGSHACTAVVDLWLQLLQLALHLSHNLPKGPADPLARQASLTDAMEPVLDIRSQVAQLVKSYQASLQELMTQLLVHWKVLSFALKPRALWVAAHHLELTGRMDGLWSALLNAVADLVSGNEAELDARRAKAGMNAAADGKLAARSNNPFSAPSTDSAGSAPAEASQGAVDEGDIEAEGIESALVSLERVTAMLTLNCIQGVSPGMKDIAAKIGDVLRPYSKGSRVGLDTRDRLQRVLKQTQPIATTDLRPLSTEQGPTEDGDAPSQPPPREDPVRLKLSPSWQVNEGYPMAAPTSTVLQGTKRATRYWPLYTQVLTAAKAAYSSSEAGLSKAATKDPLDDINSLPGIAEVMSLVTGLGSDEAAGREEVSGPTDPLRVVVSHILQPSTRSVSFTVELLNRLTADIKGLVLRLSLGGPVIPDTKQPALYKIPLLPVGERVLLHLTCTIGACGALSIQPFVALPVSMAGEDLSLRCGAYVVPSTALLVPPPLLPPSADFFHQMASMAYGCHICGVCTIGGWEGGLALLSKLERSPLTKIMLRGLPAQGGFEAAYYGSYWDGSAAALVVTGQLLPTGMPTDGQPDSGSISNGNQPAASGSSSHSASTSRVVCRMTFKSTSMELMSSVDNARGAWLAQITKGSLVEGFNSQSLSLASVLPHLHPSVAPLKAAYTVPKSSSLEDSGIISEDAAAPSVFEDVLAQEWRRLQAVVV